MIDIIFLRHFKWALSEFLTETIVVGKGLDK